MKLLDKTTSRRQFLVGAGIAAGTTVMLNKSTQLAFASPSDPNRGDAVVVIFLRFGWDALSVVPPITGRQADDLAVHRPNIRVVPEDALPLNSTNPNVVFPTGFDGMFGLNPRLSHLYEGVWASGNMAIIQGSGLPDYESTNRSHFRVQPYIEYGANNENVRSGWLTRIIEGQSASGLIPGVSATNGAVNSYRGRTDALAINNLATHGIDGFRDSRNAVSVLDNYYNGTGQVEQTGAATLLTLSAVAGVDPNGGSGYPDTTFGNDLRDIANLLKADIGLTTALVNQGQYDTHRNQNGRFGRNLDELSPALQAFIDDLGDSFNETTICLVTDFGRTIDQNANNGTDHGRGGSTMIMGGGVQGGVFGYDFPDELDPNALRRALPVLTDYRKPMDEIVRARVGVEGSFPTMRDLPDLGVVRS